jgi:hypothetical protein
MNEWKEPWMCEKCGRIFRYSDDAQDARNRGSHANRNHQNICTGKLKLYDRRIPSPAAELVREAIELFQNEPGELARGEEDMKWTTSYNRWLTRADAFLADVSQAEPQEAKP